MQGRRSSFMKRNNMAEKIYRLEADYLEQFMTDVFVKKGVPPEDAGICADVLITSDSFLIALLL